MKIQRLWYYLSFYFSLIFNYERNPIHWNICSILDQNCQIQEGTVRINDLSIIYQKLRPVIKLFHSTLQLKDWLANFGHIGLASNIFIVDIYNTSWNSPGINKQQYIWNGLEMLSISVNCLSTTNVLYKIMLITENKGKSVKALDF